MFDWRDTMAFRWWVVRFDAERGTHFAEQGAPEEVHEFFAARMEEDVEFWRGSDFDF